MMVFSDFIQCKCVNNPGDLTGEYVVHLDDFSEISFFDKEIAMYDQQADFWERTSADVLRERIKALEILAKM